ncbi:MAG: FHA domain-containing protein [Oscillatoriales cyanobacterium SM2_2_1]|nr:FHA domain-containing protein [Oscillatoriales cyanobacterium SM2_2_1]
MSEATVNHILQITDAKGIRKIPLDGLKYTIGRDVDNNIQLYSRFVSRHHAILLRVPSEHGQHSYRIIDGDLSGKPSVNGVVINHQTKVSSYDLKHGDAITLAPNVEMVYAVAEVPVNVGN